MHDIGETNEHTQIPQVPFKSLGTEMNTFIQQRGIKFFNS